MTRWTLVLWTLGLAAFSSPAWGQAVAQYGVAAGNSAVTTSRTASALASKTNQLNDRTGSSVKSLVSAMQENRERLEAKSQKNGGTVHIDSVPGKATVFIDGAIVAYTPADLKIPQGKHRIEVKHPVSLPWEKEISLESGEKLSLQADLKDKYKSVLNFTIQK